MDREVMKNRHSFEERFLNMEGITREQTKYRPNMWYVGKR